MGFLIDFSEIEKLVKNQKVAEKQFNFFLRKFLASMAFDIVAETKEKQTGNRGERFKAYDTGAMAGAWEFGEITGNGKDISVEILNPMEYADFIEYGHRITVGSGKNKREVGWYQGRFMLTTSIDEVRREMPKRYKQAFETFCKVNGIA